MTLRTSLTIWIALLAIAAGGCTTKTRARAESKAAYNAGRARAYEQMLDTQRLVVRVEGNVRNPQIQWTDGMSLMEAIVKAECTDQHDPREIVVVRQNQRIRVDLKAFLGGEDVLLEPGDIVEIHP